MATTEEATTGVTGTTRPASLVVGIVVAGGLVTVAALSDAVVGVGLTAAAGCALGLTVHCRARDGPGWTAVAAGLTPLVAVGGAGGVVLVAAERSAAAPGGLLVLPAVGIALGVALAAFGATGALGGGIGTGAVARTWHTTIATVAVVGIGVGVGVVIGGRVAALRSLPVQTVDPGPLLGPVVAPIDATVALTSFAVLGAALAYLCRAALATLPVVELTSRRRREAIRRAVMRADTALLAAGRYGILLACASTLTFHPAIRSTLPVGAVADLVVGTDLRWTLLTIAGIAGLVTLIGRLLRAVAGDAASILGRVLPAMAGGVGVVLVAIGGDRVVRSTVADVPRAIPVVETARDALSPTGIALGGTLVALVALTALLSGLVAAGVVGLVPARGRGGTLAGVGLGSCAVLVAVDGGPALATFALVGAGIVAWDVSDQGVAARAELGASSAVRIEAVHAVTSLGVACLGVLAAWGVAGVVGAVARPAGVLVGAVVAVSGAVILLGALRG